MYVYIPIYNIDIHDRVICILYWEATENISKSSVVQ